MSFACLFLSSLSKLSSVSVVFDFNASLNAVAPVSSILLTVDEKGKKKSELLIDVICVFFCLHNSNQVQ